MSDNNIAPLDSWVRKGLYTLFYKELASTNRTASELIQDNKINGPTAIISEYQKFGRGQLQTKWHSSSGNNLTFSLAYPKFNRLIEKQFKINKCLSLAVKSVIENTGIQLKIKWPNDIYYNNKKLSGLLVENQISGQNIVRCIAGIGINVNEDNWPSEIPNPISLKQITGIQFNIQELYDNWIPQIHEKFNSLLLKSDQAIDQKYKDSLFGIDEWLRFSSRSLQFEAKIIDVNSTGEMVLIKKSGSKESYRFKEIEFLIDN